MILRRAFRKTREVAERVAARARAAELAARFPSLSISPGTHIGPGCQIIAADGSELILDDAYIAQGVVLRTAPGAHLRITKSYVGFNSVVAAAQRVTIGAGCKIAEMVVIRDADHVFGSGVPLMQSGLQSGPVAIGENVWIGAKATILRDVTIGDHAVVAASAVVTKPVEARTLVGGVPAKVLKRL